MKRSVGLILASLLIAALLVPSVASAASVIRIRVNGQYLTNMDVDPVNMNGRVFVPARFVAEALGASVDWDGANQTVVVTSRPPQPPRWSGTKGVYVNLTDAQIQDAILYAVANKDKSWEEFHKGYFSDQPAWNWSGQNQGILRTEWLEVAWQTRKALLDGKPAPSVEEARYLFHPGEIILEVWMWGDSEEFTQYIEGYLKQGNQIIKPIATYRNVDQGNTGYFQTGIPSHYGDNLYVFSTNGLDLSAPIEALVLSAAGEENRFSWKLGDLK